MSSGIGEVDERVARLKTADDCDQFAKNAVERDRPDLANQAHRRAVELRTDAHGARTDAERECLKAVYAYQQVLATRMHHRVHLWTTWQTINRRGVVHAVERAVIRGTEMAYHAALQEMGLDDLAFEAVVVRHPALFSAQTVQRATKRVSEWKQRGSGAKASAASNTRSSSRLRQLEAPADRHQTAQRGHVQDPLRTYMGRSSG